MIAAHIQLVDGAGFDAVGAYVVAVCDVQVIARKHSLYRQKLWAAADLFPSIAAVVRPVDPCSRFIRNPDKNYSRALRAREQNEADTGIGRPALLRQAQAPIRKRLYPVPAGAAIARAPETVVAGAEIQDIGVMRIHRQPLTQSTAVLVAAHAEGYRYCFPVLTAVEGAQHGRGIALIHPRRHMHHVRIPRVHGDALDAEIAGLRHLVLQGYPALSILIPAIGATHVRAQVGESLLRFAENNIRREAAGADCDIAPVVAFASTAVSGNDSQKNCSN